MIIKNIYIENFGCLKNFKYDFKKELNTICEENGFGKTTLAHFIKAIFYGMPNRNVKEISKNERKKYYPWQGGKYGGYIEFSANDGEYRLERYFGKTEKDDITTLYNLTTNKIEPFAMELGEKYFEIDADGFTKTIFITDNNNTKFENLSIQSLLTNANDSVNDLNEYDNALDVLDEKRKYYLKINGSGKLNDIKNDISEIKQELTNITYNEEFVNNLKRNIEEINDELITLEDKKKKLEYYLKSNQRQLEVIAKNEHLKSLQNDMDNIKEKLKEYSLFFAKYLPSEEEIQEMAYIEKEVEQLKYKYNQLMPSESDYLFYQNKKQEFCNLNAKNVENAINLAINNGGGKTKKSNIKIIFYILSFFSALAGAYLLNNNIIIATCLFALSLITLLLGLSCKNKYNKSSLIVQLKKILPNISLSERNCLNELFELKASLNKWSNINNYLKQTNTEIEKIKSNLIDKTNRLNYFLMNFDKSENDTNTITFIKSKYDTYNILLNQLNEKQTNLQTFVKTNSYIKETNIEVQNADEQLSNINMRINLNKEKLFEYSNKLLLVNEKLASKNESIRQYEYLQEEYNNAKNDYEIIIKTIELLKKAKENLNLRYLVPMQSNLNGILKGIDTKLISNAILDIDLNASIESNGGYKLVDYYSKGYKCIMNFCIRLAFIKSVYKNEKPFLVIDDAFLSLDSENFKKISVLINEIAKDFQIIYFVCSRNRTL